MATRKNWIEQAEENGVDLVEAFEAAHEVPVQLAAQYRALIETACYLTLAQQLELITEVHAVSGYYWLLAVDGRQLIVIRQHDLEYLQVFDRSNLLKAPLPVRSLQTVLTAFERKEMEDMDI
jgi:hypothetical protein